MAEAVGMRTRSNAQRWGILAIAALVLFGLSYAAVSTDADGPSLWTRVVSALIGVSVGLGALAVIRSEEISQKLKGVMLLGLAGGLWFGYLVEPKVRSTVVGVVVAIVASALLFVGANSWFNLARAKWPIFGAVTGAAILGFLSLILVGNDIMAMSNTSWLVPIIGIGLGAGFGALLTRAVERSRRLITGIVGGLAIGGFVIAFLRPSAYPAIRTVDIIVWPVVVAAAGAAVSALRGRLWWYGAIAGAIFGLFVAAWLAPDRFGGAVADAVVGTVGLGGLVGLRLGLKPAAEYKRRVEVEQGARAVIFLAPGLLFIGATLVIPTIRTIYLSFLDARSQESVGWANYATVLSDQKALDFSKWTGVFTSSLLWWAVILGLIGLIAGYLSGRSTGEGFRSTGLSVGPMAVGAFLFGLAIFSNFRGTVFNNLWWVFTVTILASAFGLAIAVLADRAKFESVAKSIIFLPMAISFVGASIIWRFVYIARPVQKDQTGILNSAWVWLGKTSTSNAKYVLLAIFLILIAGSGYLAYRAFRAEANGVLFGAGSIVAIFAWFSYRLLGPGLGGIARTVGDKTFTETIIFTQEGPFNNMWLMVVLIWIQTGFTMVIFSAAIKAVPAELIEASRVDGATETQTFWRVTIPQIAPTIGVVTTTLIVLVMKVFDVVKVITNGNFGTEVIANLMWTRGFSEFNLGLGATLAVLLFISILPVMVINIRRMQREAQ